MIMFSLRVQLAIKSGQHFIDRPEQLSSNVD